MHQSRRTTRTAKVAQKVLNKRLGRPPWNSKSVNGTDIVLMRQSLCLHRLRLAGARQALCAGRTYSTSMIHRLPQYNLHAQCLHDVAEDQRLKAQAKRHDHRVSTHQSLERSNQSCARAGAREASLITSSLSNSKRCCCGPCSGLLRASMSTTFLAHRIISSLRERSF
jgi:hypothetical protein